MTTSLLIPIRPPELGPSLGKVVVGTGHSGLADLDLSPIRLRLATRVFDFVGEARRLTGEDERQSAIEAIGRTSWLGAWEEAVNSVTNLVVDRANARIGAAADVVRMPPRRRKNLFVTPRERRTLHARLGSTAASMVKSLDDVEAWSAKAVIGTSGDGMRSWREAIRTAARRLEDAWLALEQSVVIEAGKWDGVVRDVSAWKKPMWPVVITGILATAGAVWLGLVFGGYIDSPPWFTSAWSAVVGP
jgi:hypothetical protein